MTGPSGRKGTGKAGGSSTSPSGQKGANRARAVAAEKLARQRAAERRRKATFGALIAAAVLVAAALIGVAVYSTQDKAPANFDVPAGGDKTGIAIGKADAKVTVDLYIDYQCPHCKEFEDAAGPTIDKLVADGTARFVYHPVAYLDGASTTEYSTRASAAAGCAADAGVFPEFTKALFANQPAEGSAGLDNAKLIELGKAAGASSGDFATCVNDGKYRDWTAALTETASKQGITGTPTVLVAGKALETPTAEALQQAVEQAAAK
jgi:protein-disulfide isomerase